MGNEHEPTVRELEMRVDSHESICAERYKRLDENISRLDRNFDVVFLKLDALANRRHDDGQPTKVDKTLLSMAGSIIFLLLAVIGFLYADAQQQRDKIVDQRLQQRQG